MAERGDLRLTKQAALTTASGLPEPGNSDLFLSGRLLLAALPQCQHTGIYEANIFTELTWGGALLIIKTSLANDTTLVRN